jgi:hypothetical protein
MVSTHQAGGGARRDACRRSSLLSSCRVVAIEGEARRWGGERTLRMYASSAASSSFNRGSEVSVVSIADLDPIVRARGLRARDGLSSTATSSKANVDSFGKIVFLQYTAAFSG